MSAKKGPGLLERLEGGGIVICAEGYLFEFEKRCYLKGGAYVPEVVLENSHLVRNMHQEFVHAGSDVVEAFTYATYRDKLKIIGREDEGEKLNRQALRLARQVADETGTLMAGNICTIGTYNPDNEESIRRAAEMFKEQVEWAIEEGADYMIGETFHFFGDAMLGIEAINKYGKGCPSVITIVPQPDEMTFDGVNIFDACKRLKEAGADVVGFNCWMGPETILPFVKRLRETIQGPIACLPVPYRTTDQCKTHIQFRDANTKAPAYHENLCPFQCSRSDIRKMALQLKELGVQYMGLCCGGQAHYFRAMAEALGRKPPASRYSTDMKDSFSGETSAVDQSFMKAKYEEKLGKLAEELYKE